MRVVKLTKRDLKKGWGHILNKCGLVYENRAEPGNLYMSKQDIEEVRIQYRAELRKEKLPPKRIAYSEGWAFLNLGANTKLEFAIKPGFALVSDDIKD